MIIMVDQKHLKVIYHAIKVVLNIFSRLEVPHELLQLWWDNREYQSTDKNRAEKHQVIIMVVWERWHELVTVSHHWEGDSYEVELDYVLLQELGVYWQLYLLELFVG